MTVTVAPATPESFSEASFTVKFLAFKVEVPNAETVTSFPFPWRDREEDPCISAEIFPIFPVNLTAEAPERFAMSSLALTSRELSLPAPLAVASTSPELILSIFIEVAPDIDSWTLSEFMDETPAISATPLQVR